MSPFVVTQSLEQTDPRQELISSPNFMFKTAISKAAQTLHMPWTGQSPSDPRCSSGESMWDPCPSRVFSGTVSMNK
ncbi:hypothetical protein H920_12448 [Fukomys damarensis]|uniref:Uncharacterized protein n=1 Tax=Fukomys damarensis TaxID=885580 RepID=A0A091D6M8_FUKDA|nr:hypothetical protein H920_12448 [Fukomys damarensis]